MRFQVTQQYGRGPEHPIGTYRELAEARGFMETKLLADAQLKVNSTYRIYEWDDLIDEQSSVSWQNVAAEQSSSRTGTGSTFNPTPLATAPRPTGALPSSFKKEDDKSEND